MGVGTLSVPDFLLWGLLFDMSRPLKTGLDYFPVDVDMDDKVELIEAKHGIMGFGVLIKLYQRIYKEGYFLKWNEETLLLFSKRVNVDINKVIDIINDCLRYQLFDESLFKKHQILTSPGIQRRYLQAIDRRKDIELIKNYIIVDINGLNVNINWINTDNNTQRKEKKSKENKSKEEKSKKAQPALKIEDLTDELKQQEPYIYSIGKLLLDYCPDVMTMKYPMALIQLKSLVKKYGAEPVEDVIKAMQNKGNEYLNKHGQYAYLTAEQWIKIRKK